MEVGQCSDGDMGPDTNASPSVSNTLAERYNEKELSPALTLGAAGGC